MDEARLNGDGVAPLKPFLAQIDALADAPGIAAYLTDSFSKGNQYVFSFGPEADFKDARNVIGYAFQGGLSLPEKAYYLEPQYQDKRDAFLGHVERMLVLAGIDAESAKAQAQAVLAFETRLANASLARVELRNPANQYHFVSVEEADKLTPNFSWSKLLAAEGVTGVKGFSLSQPKFFAEMDKMLTSVPVADWQAYLRYHTVADSAVYLSDALSNERFDFYGKTMRGQQEQKPRWKRVLDTINGTMGEALGQVYVQQVFPESSKEQMLQLVTNLREALKVRLEKLDWMSEETKAKALAKWNTFQPKVGYPDKWRDYSGLTIDRGKSYFDNVLVASAFENAFQMAKIGKPVDRQEWGMPAADGQRLLQPAHERDRVPGRHPAAAVLRSRSRPGLELRRHRRGHRPRDAARLRRPGQPVRRRGQQQQLVDRSRPEEIPGSHRQAGRAVRRLRGGRQPARQRTADPGREHRRPRWLERGLRRPATRSRATSASRKSMATARTSASS